MISDFSQPEFEQRLGEICGLYVDPLENVLVVSIDEKTAIQAQSPTQPDTPPQPASRRGASTSTSATARSGCSQRAEIAVIEGQQIVAISDKLSTRGTQEVQDWLAAHPRWRLQFTPTHASWLNQIEIFLSILWRRLQKHGIFTSQTDLAEQMLAFIETYNQTAKPFTWTYTGKVLQA